MGKARAALGLVALLLLMPWMPSTAMASEGRANEGMSIILAENLLLSSEALEADIGLWGLSAGSNYTLDWAVIAGNQTNWTSADISTNGTLNFTASAAGQQIPFVTHHFVTDSAAYRLHITLRDAAGGELTNASRPFAAFYDAVAPNWTDFIMFGDSLSDSGNSYAAYGTPDSPPYWNGRFSNGAVWLEHVHDWMGVSTQAGRGSSSGNNRAFGGASSANGLSYFVIPNVGRQVDDYTANQNIAATEAVGILAGGNDLLNYGETDPQNILDNIEEHTLQLINDGATSIIWTELPGLEKAPKALEDNTPEENAALHERILAFNTGLHALANQTATAQGVDITIAEIWELFEQMIHSPSYFGLTNVTHPACDHDGLMCEQGDTIAANEDEYVFFDKIHPTRTTHTIVGMAMRDTFGERDYDGDGIADADDDCDDTLPGIEVGTDGCDLPPPDEDGDGVIDDLDDCPETDDGLAVDEDGCALNQKDADGDGVSDASDQCNDTPAGESVNAFGCSDSQLDTDGDGVSDADDRCSNTGTGLDVDGDGCADEQLDSDEDGVDDAADDCPNTPRGESVGLDGCAASQRDHDLDGVSDADDTCPQTPVDERGAVDDLGCGPSERDADEDGVSDADDACADTPFLSATIDAEGCDDTQRDTDGDGPKDADDECPITPGSIRGCPTIQIEITLANTPAAWNASAEIEVNVTCEADCILLFTSGESTRNITTGTIQVVLPANEAGYAQYTGSLSVENITVSDTLEITWPAKPAEPVDNPEPTTEEPGVCQGCCGATFDAPADGICPVFDCAPCPGTEEKSGVMGMSMGSLAMVALMLIANVIVIGAILRSRSRRSSPPNMHQLAGASFERELLGDAAWSAPPKEPELPQMSDLPNIDDLLK